MKTIHEILSKLQEHLLKGRIDSFLPLLPFIQIDGKPMTLDNHYPLEPFFRLKLPRRLVFMCGRQVGKCLVKSSTQSIYKDNGYPIKTIDLQKDLSLITKNDNLKVDYNPILNIFNNGVQSALRITTRRGSIIEVTPNHKLYTVLGYKEAQDISVGDFLMYPKKAGLFKNIFMLENRIKATAYLIGDGSIQKTVSFTSNDPFCIQEYVDCVENKCNIQSKQKTDAKSVQAHRSANVNDWMIEDGLMNTYSDTKFIPEWVFNLSPDQTALFISRLWATDGSIKLYNKFPSITYCSVSRDLIYQVQSLLMKFGITSAIRCKKAGYKDKMGNRVVCKDAYELRVEGRESWSIFLNTFEVPGKPSVDIPTTLSNSNRDIVPIDVRDILKDLFRDVMNTKKGNSLRSNNLKCRLKYNTTYSKLKRLLDFADSHNLQEHPAYKKLYNIYHADFKWDCIRKIEKIEAAETIDLEIKENHNYFLNGIAVHNSISLAVRGVLDSSCIPNFQTLFVQPRYDQVKRFSNNYMRTILHDSPLGQILVDPKGEQSILQRSFKNGSNMHFSYALLDADRCRGYAVAKCVFDETLWKDTPISVIDPVTFKKSSLPISEIKAGMMVESFTDDGYIIYSVVSDDASYHGERDCYKITTEQGRTIEGTLDHPLWTDQGPMRIGEMVEYVYGTTKEFKGGSERRTNSDGAGDDVGRWSPECSCLQEDRLLQSSTRRSTTQIQSGKIHNIVRIRYKTARAEEERKIQSILLGNSQTQTLSLSIQNDIQQDNGEGVPQESCNTGMVESVRREGTSMVGTGRRMSNKPQVHDNMHTGVFHGGEHVVSGLVTDNIQSNRNNTDGYLKRTTVPSAECGEHLQTCKDDKTICCREYDVQVKEDSTYMSGMSGGIIPGNKTRDLFQGEIRESSEEVGKRTYRRVKGIQKDLGGETQGSGKRMFSRTICSRSGKRERVSEDIQGETSGTRTGYPEEILPIREGYAEGQGKVFKEISQRYEGPGESCSYQSQEDTVVGRFEERPCEVRGVQGKTERVFPEIQGAVKGKESFDRIVSIEHTGIKPVYDIEVVGTHNYVLANSCKSLNCQDIQHDFIPIIGETMSAQIHYGFYQFSGTPKTMDNTLNALYSDSSMAEWVIKCEHCNHFNIPNLDNDIMKMIGKKTCICAKCGKALDISVGQYVHAETSKINSFRGYHISQITHPLHAGYESKWAELLYKKETYSEAKFYNEILGEPCDEAVKPLTEGDIRAASNGLKNEFKAAVKERAKYDSVMMGVDWSGYGADNCSTTALAIVGVIPGSEVVHCIYCERFKPGIKPEEEARILVNYASQFRITYLAHDFTGAGMIREATLIQQGYPANQVIPFQIVHAPIAHSIINYYQPPSGGRYCYNIDKTRSLMVLYEMIKKQKVTLPDWETNGGETKDVLRDLLNINQETRETPRGGEFTLMIKSPNKTDDFAHALNFACAAIWHIRGRYPSLVGAASLPEHEDMLLMDPQAANWQYD